MIVAVRADALPVSGSGHVMRCLSLARGLRAAGATVSFVCDGEGTFLCDSLEQAGFQVSRLQGPAFAWSADAGQTGQAIDAVSGAPADWLVADHYGIDHRWERTLREKARRILVVDDLADREHDCDLLLDQNLIDGTQARYAGKVPAACGLLLGPRYALLHPDYRELHDRTAPRQGPIRRILVFTSGSDPANLTGRIVTAIQSLDRADIEVDVVVAAGSVQVPALRQQAAGQPNLHLHCGLPTLAPLMARADLAIGAAGGATWERLCLGLPSLVITMAGNQRPIAATLHAEGLIRWLGDQEVVTVPDIARVLGELIGQGLDRDWSERCRALVDGRGAERVCAAMGLVHTWN